EPGFTVMAARNEPTDRWIQGQVGRRRVAISVAAPTTINPTASGSTAFGRPPVAGRPGDTARTVVVVTDWGRTVIVNESDTTRRPDGGSAAMSPVESVAVHVTVVTPRG